MNVDPPPLSFPFIPSTFDIDGSDEGAVVRGRCYGYSIATKRSRYLFVPIGQQPSYRLCVLDHARVFQEEK